MKISGENLRRIYAVMRSPVATFVELVKAAELDPGLDFRGENLRGVKLNNEILSSFDFTDSDLSYADIRGADLSETFGLYEAKLDHVIADERTKWPALTRRVMIVNPKGLHARASAMVVARAETFNAEIGIARLDDYEVVSACSIMSVMMLGAVLGTELKLVAYGQEAKQALDAIEALFKSGLGNY